MRNKDVEKSKKGVIFSALDVDTQSINEKTTPMNVTKTITVFRVFDDVFKEFDHLT